MEEDLKKQCAYIRKNGKRCQKYAREGDDYCWVHQGGEVSEEVLDKLQIAKFGSDNGNLVHGLHSNVLKLMCNNRCYMYEDCQVHTDTDEGRDLYGGVCFYELDSGITEEQLLQMEGLKKFIIRIMKILEARINRGIRYELATGGFLSEPQIGDMIRTVSNLGFNLSGIYEKEEIDDLREQLEQVRELYKKAVKEVE